MMDLDQPDETDYGPKLMDFWSYRHSPAIKPLTPL
jgi:hypothetical protein